MSEEKLNEKFKVYKELAKTNKDIDVASLMIKDLETAKDNFLPAKQKRWAYLLSLFVPLVGFFFAIKYFNSEAEDALEAALACAVMACVSILIFYFMGQGLLGGTNIEQLQNIKPSDVYDLTQ